MIAAHPGWPALLKIRHSAAMSITAMARAMTVDIRLAPELDVLVLAA
jgi:hypothetical protein